MSEDNTKKIIFYVIGIVVMVALFLFIVKGVKDMVSSQLSESDTTEVTETEVDMAAQIAADRATLSTTEISTEPVTEAEVTTQEYVEETTQELTVDDDVSAPVFLVLPSSVSIKEGTPFYILDYVGYADDVDKLPELETEGEVNTSATGSYPLTLKLTDKAGHTTTGKMVVNVYADSSTSTGDGGADNTSSEKPKQDFETFKTTYKNDNTSLGIDVSRWQEDVDYVKVKDAGCEFVIIRIGGFDDGSEYIDKYFKSNIEHAKAAGLKVGIYWHAEENSTEQVKKNVDYMMSALAGEELDFPIAYDWEDFSHFPKYAMNLHDINNCFETFCNSVKAYGYDACLYSSRNFLDSVWTNENKHPVWLANYTASTGYSGDFYMWQQSNTGSIPGVNGDVDLNILYLDKLGDSKKGTDE